MVICVDSTMNQKCPITDIKLVEKSEFLAEQYPNYTVADGPEDLSWNLLYSTDSGDLPISQLKMTEERPCSLDNTQQVKTSVTRENMKGRTRDSYKRNCRRQPLDGDLEVTYRSASQTITVNEAEWLEWIGVFRLIDNLPKTKSSKSYKDNKRKNEL